MPTLADEIGSGYEGGLTQEDYARQAPSGPTEADLASKPTWGDYLNNVKAGYHAAISDYYGYHAQNAEGDDQRYLDELSQQHRAYGQSYLDDLSPAAKNAGFVSRTMQSLAYTAPGMTAMGGVAAAGGALAGPIGAGAAFAGISGAQAMQSSVASARDYVINQAPEEELMRIPEYAAKKQFMSTQDARTSFVSDKINEQNLKLKSFIGGAGSAIAGEAIGGPEASSLLGRVGRGALGGAAMGVIQTPITDLALGNISPGLQKSSTEIGEETVSSAAGLGALGAVGGLARRARTDNEPLPNTSGSGRSTSLSRQAETKQRTINGSQEAEKVSPSPPPPSPTDDAQKLALGAQLKTGKITPESNKTLDIQSTSQVGELTGEPQEQRSQTPPVSPPQIPPEPQPAASPAPANAQSPPLPIPPERQVPPVSSPSVPVSFPESRETLQLQQQALLEGKKEAIVYPQSQNVIPLPKDTLGVKQIKAGGDIWQFRTDGPNNLSASKIYSYIQRGKTNELLGYGPISKEEAQARSAAGETPAAIVERTPEGTETKTAAGTIETAPAQIQAFEKEKLAPENKVVAEPPEKVVQERVQAAQTPTPRVLEDTTQLKQEGFKPPGIIETTEKPMEAKKRTEAERTERLNNNLIADQVLSRHPLDAQEAMSALQGDRGARLKFLNKLKTMLEDANNSKLKIPRTFKDNTDQSMNHSPAAGIIHEANRLVNKAAKEGSPAYQRFIRNVNLLTGENGYKNYVETRRAEAKEILKHPDVGKKQIETEEVTPRVKQTVAEKLKQQQQEHMEARRRESEEIKKAQEEKMRQQETEVTHVGFQTKGPTVVVTKSRVSDKLKQIREDQKARQEKFKIEGEPTEAQIKAGNYSKIHTRLEGEGISIETGKGEERQPYPVKVPQHYGYIKGTIGKDGDHLDAYIGPKGETGRIFIMNQLGRGGVFDEHKIFMGFDTKNDAMEGYINSFTNRRNVWRRIGGMVELTHDEFKDWLEHGDKFQEINEGMEGENLEHTIESQFADKTYEIPYDEKYKVSDVLGKIDTGYYSKSMRPMVNILIKRLQDILKDTPVYTISNKAALDVSGDRNFAGYYNTKYNHILINREVYGENYDELATTIIHEAFHAATLYGLHNDNHLYNLAERLYDEVKPFDYLIPKEVNNALTSPVEMFTEIVSNPLLQQALKKIPISHDLATALDMPRWRKASMYQGAIDWFRKLLGLGPRQYNVIEAAFNIGDRAMWARQPEQEFAYVRRASIFSRDEDGVAGAFRPVTYSRSIDKVPDTIKKGIDSLVSKSGRDLKQTLYEKGMKFIPMMDMVYGNEGKFGIVNEHNPLRLLGNMAQKMEAFKEEIRKGWRPAMTVIQKFIRSNPDETEDVHKLLQESDFFNIHPAFELEEGPNKNIKPNNKNIENTNIDYWESVIHHARLSAAYENLSYAGQKTFNTIYNMLKSLKGKEISVVHDNLTRLANEAINNNIERPDAAEYKTALGKVIEGKELDEEENKKYYDDPIVAGIRNVKSMLKRNENGFYYPAKRQGKLAVTANYDYNIPDSGIRSPDDSNKIIFQDRKQAFDFVRDLKTKGTKEDFALPSNTQIKHYFLGDDGTKTYVPANEIRNIEGKDVLPKEEYQVTVNNKHVEFMDSLDEGHRVADALRDFGAQDVKNPIAREDNPYLDYSLYGSQVEAFKKNISRMQHISTEAKQAAREAVEHVAIASMQGNRISKSLLRKYRVRGASDDILQTMDSHLGATATHLANGTYRPDIDKLLARVNESVEGARQENSDKAYEMSTVAQEMETRINGFRQGSYGEMSRGFLHNIAVLGLWKFLFSPAHFALHLMHPVITSIPEMSSEHGWGATYRTMISAYRDMGHFSPMLAGAKSAVQRAMDFDKLPENFLESMKQRLRESGRDAATLDMVNELESSGYLTHNGLEFKPFYQKSGGPTYWADRSMGIIQELNNSAENINRVGTAVAAFDLARRKGLNNEAATDYAKKIISNTHGLYNNINRAPMMMKHPVVRSMLQFKTFPMMIYRILARNVYNIVKGDTKEARWQAFKALSGMVATAAFFTGAQGATPEPFRLAVTMGNLLGLNDSWEQQQDRITRTLASNFSPEIAQTVQHGMGHVIGWDLHHRLGIDDLMVFAQPQTSKPEDVQNWFSNAVLGTPWGMGTDAYTGYQSLIDGDYSKAINMLLPKAIVDLSKAYQLSTEGKLTSKGQVLVPQLSPMALLGQALGFIPSKVAEAGQARAAYGADQAKINQEKQNVIQLWRQGKKGEAIAAMRDFNNKHPTDRMRLPQLQQRDTILGYSATPRKEQELKERARLYGLQ